MNILEGQLPDERKMWHVLIPRSPGLPLGKSWQLALLLAKAGMGSVLLALPIHEDSEEARQAARETIRQAEEESGRDVKIYALIVTVAEYESQANTLIREWDVDVLVDDIADPIEHDLNRCPCAVAAVRGDISTAGAETAHIGCILVPTSGGPNTVYALSALMPLAPEVRIVALYVAQAHLGNHEEALGRHRLRQTLEFIDGQDVIETRLITSENITDGIRESARGSDLVLIGASRESSIDKILFGNIPDQLVRESKTTVVVMREPKSRWSHMLGDISWRLQRILPRLSLHDRTDAYVRIRRAARPNIDYYILISLASIIAGLGLIVNSGAVVIGAMLVAPLMSPIVGTGLSIVLGDTRFLRLTLGAVLRGALLAIFLGMIVGLFQIGKPLTPELAARTNPSLLDLAIALFSGMAAAFALSRSNAAGALPGVAIAAALVPPLATTGITFTAGYYVESLGALLLFITNFVAIGSATALVFLILGFRPAASQKARVEVRARSARVAAVSLAIITALLVITSYILGQQQAQQTRIHEVVEQKLSEVARADLADLTIVDFSDGKLTLDIIARSSHAIGHQTVQDLQEEIGTQLVGERIIDEIALTLTVIRVTDLDPLIPPTPTPGPSPTPEPTLNPELEPAAGVMSGQVVTARE